MRYIFDGIKKCPHPEEAAQRLSRRTHCADPAARQFFHKLRGGCQPAANTALARISQTLSVGAGPEESSSLPAYFLFVPPLEICVVIRLLWQLQFVDPVKNSGDLRSNELRCKNLK
jgi:hypothetical protein